MKIGKLREFSDKKTLEMKKVQNIVIRDEHDTINVTFWGDSVQQLAMIQVLFMIISSDITHFGKLIELAL